MKRTFLTTLILLATALWAQAQTAPSEEETLVVHVGQVAPDFEVQMGHISGAGSNAAKFEKLPSVRLSDFRGKVVLVTFWATWCPDCRVELAHLVADILPKLKEANFVFLPISARERGDAWEKVGQFMLTSGYQFATGIDAASSIYKLFTTNYVPRNFLIDENGIIVATSTDVGFAEKVEAKLLEMVK